MDLETFVPVVCFGAGLVWYLQGLYLLGGRRDD